MTWTAELTHPFSLIPGSEVPGKTEVSPRPGGHAGQRGPEQTSAGAVQHSHARQPPVHCGDQGQNAPLPEQTPAGFHTLGHGQQVGPAADAAASFHRPEPAPS